MSEQKFLSRMNCKLKELRQVNAELDDEARIALTVLKNFKPTLYSLLERNKEDEFLLRLKDLTTEECNTDLMSLIDSEVRRELHMKGYYYIENESDNKKLLFRKITDE